jgi:hypothetical protein
MMATKAPKATETQGQSSGQTSGRAQEQANENLLNAGAILVVGAPTPSTVPVASQEVRRYQHEALGGRLVAKLTSADLAPAVDATMEFLGFSAPESSGAVGLALHGALGFPESALIIDPKNARYALGVVKDLNRLGRMAKGRPGASKEGMEKLGATLGNSVPHFLPSYFEQCGRIFMALENTVYAGAMFVKARAAENTFGLVVNEDHRRAAFLEFAFAGALPGKALDEYAKDLAKVYPADVAFGHFRSLTLQRCRGGLAPWAQMMDVVKRMAKAAGADVDQAQGELLAELLSSPALRFASLTFWKSVRSLAIGMAKVDPAIKGTLLNFHAWWLELLKDCGALEALCTLDDAAVPAEALPAGGPAAWLNRVVGSFGYQADTAVLNGLLETMAPRLRRDHEAADAAYPSGSASGKSSTALDKSDATAEVKADVASVRPVTSVQFHSTWWVKVDLLDYALELGIACDAETNPNFSYRLDQKHLRPLTFLGAAEHLRGPLRRAVENGMVSELAATMFACSGLHGLMAEWIGARVDAIAPPEGTTLDSEGSGALDFIAKADELVKTVTVAMLALVPGAKERLSQMDVPASLARQLQLGMFAEFCWPALEDMMAKLVGDRSTSKGSSSAASSTTPLTLSLDESWPYLIVHDLAKAYVIDHERVVLEHDLRWAPTSWQRRTTFVDGALFAGWYGQGYTYTCYWSNDANNVITEDVELGYRSDNSSLSFEVPGGGRTFGGKAMQVGDRKCPGVQPMAFDGRNYWVSKGEWANGEYVFGYTEFDPTTGKTGRTSLPAFAEAELGADRSVLSLQMFAVPEGVSNSFLGTRNGDGVTGHVVIKQKSSTAGNDPVGIYEIIRVDGTRFVTPNGLIPDGLLTWPGVDLPYVVMPNNRVLDTSMTVSVIDEYATWPTLNGVRVPRTYWHYFSVRDAAGSAALRKADKQQLAALLDQARELSAKATRSEPFLPEGEHGDLNALAVAALPGLGDPVLIRAVVTLAAKISVSAADVSAWLDGTNRAGAAKKPEAFTDEVEELLAQAVHGVVHPNAWCRMHTQLQVLTNFFTAPDDEPTPELDYSLKRSLAGNGLTVETLLRGVPTALYSLLLPTATEAERNAIGSYLDLWLASPFSDGARLPSVTMQIESDLDPEGSLQRGPGGSRWWFGPSRMVRLNNGKRVYEFSALGSSPEALPSTDCSIVSTQASAPLIARDLVATVLRDIRERGPIGSIGAADVLSFAAATGRSKGEAAVILSGFRGIGYRSIPISKEQREHLGVKAAEIKTGAEALSTGDISTRWLALLGAAIQYPLEPQWRDDASGFVAKLAEAWVGVHGAQTVLNDAILASVDKVLKSSGWSQYKARDVLTDLDGTTPRFPTEYEHHFNAEGELVLTPGTEQLGEAWVLAVVKVAALLANDSPANDPWRAVAGKGIVAIAQRLHSPSMIWPWATAYSNSAAFERVAAELPVLPNTEAKKLIDAGDVILEERKYGTDSSWNVYLRTARYLDRSPGRVLADAARESVAMGSILDWLFSERSAQFAAHVQSPSSALDGYEQNPLLCTPALVNDVAKATGLDANAAALYLQILTLAEPTTSNIKLWNGWTAKQVNEAATALLEAGLVVSAKRAGSGRDVFLPGGWIEMRSPAIGIELWKAPFYALTDEPSKRTSYLGRILPLDPLPVLFQQAWDRWTAGDKPGFAEVGRGLGERNKKPKGVA